MPIAQVNGASDSEEDLDDLDGDGTEAEWVDEEDGGDEPMDEDVAAATDEPAAFVRPKDPNGEHYLLSRYRVA